MAPTHRPLFTAGNNILRNSSTFWEYEEPLEVDSRHPTIIGGKDYRDEPFVEIAPHQCEAIVTPCPKLLSINLLWLTHKDGPGRVYTGLTWKDLFAQKTSYDRYRWVNIAQVMQLATKKGYRTNDDYTFRLWFCAPGLIHVEESDDGEWTIKDIFDLPPWMLIG